MTWDSIFQKGKAVPSAYAVVIAIEKYHNPDITDVKHARADAEEMRDVLTGQLGVPAGNLTLLLDQDAHKANVEEQLKYCIKGLDADDRFYFFYAGHGMWANGRNRLTAWDTQLLNLPTTTIDVQKVLLNPLRDSGCKQSLIFVDACATEFKDIDEVRDLVADMSRKEFEEFISKSAYTAAFFACSAKEKSYSTSALGHGIWTFHLLEALRGEKDEALVDDKWVTGESLRDYLNLAVPRFIRKKTSIKGHQTPYALIGASGTFKITELKEATKVAQDFQLKPDFGRAFFRGSETRPFRNLPGFSPSRRHKVPEDVNPAADRWARQLLRADVAHEIQQVYEQARETLKLRPKQVDKQEDEGTGTVDTDFFRFEVYAGQSKKDHREAIVTREIQLRVPHKKLPEDFDDIFPSRVDELVLPLPGSKGQFDKLVDPIAEVAEAIDAKERDDPTKGIIELQLSDGTTIVLNTKREIITVSCSGVDGCLEIIEHIRGDELRRLIGDTPKLIGRAPSD
jgi:caspase domain-containing protein